MGYLISTNNKLRYQKVNKRKKRKTFWPRILLVLIVSFLSIANNWNVGIETKVSSKSLVDSNPDAITDFSGQDYIYLNSNTPNFIEEDEKIISGEIYSSLDLYGRCGTDTGYSLSDNHHSSKWSI